MGRREHSDANQLVMPLVYTPTTVVPAGNGEYVIKMGKPVVLSAEDEIGTAEAARVLGLSERHVRTMCDIGTFVEGRDFRRPGGERGKILLKRASVWRQSGRTEGGELKIEN